MTIVVYSSETSATKCWSPNAVNLPCFTECGWGGCNGHANRDRGPRQQFKFSNLFACPLNPLTPHLAMQWGEECSELNAVPLVSVLQTCFSRMFVCNCSGLVFVVARMRRSLTDSTRWGRSIRRSSTAGWRTSSGTLSSARRKPSPQRARTCTKTSTSWYVHAKRSPPPPLVPLPRHLGTISWLGGADEQGKKWSSHQNHSLFSSLCNCFECYTGWPKKNATLTINNFKKTMDRMKKLCALSRIKFLSQQDDTKNANFDEGVLILWPLFWCNVIFKICPSISKVTIYVPKIFHWLASPGKVSALAL